METVILDFSEVNRKNEQEEENGSFQAYRTYKIRKPSKKEGKELLSAWITQRQGRQLTKHQKDLLNEDQTHEEYPKFIKYTLAELEEGGLN